MISLLRYDMINGYPLPAHINLLLLMFSEEAAVDELIDPDTRRWDVSKVLSNFFPHQANEILKTPLSAPLPNDKIVTTEYKSGEFKVNSAYFVALRARNHHS